MDTEPGRDEIRRKLLKALRLCTEVFASVPPWTEPPGDSVGRDAFEATTALIRALQSPWFDDGREDES